MDLKSEPREACVPAEPEVEGFPLKKSTFEASDVLGVAWLAFRPHWGKLSVAVVLQCVFTASIASLLSLAGPQPEPWIAVPVQLITSFVSGLALAGVIRVCLDALEQREVQATRFFSVWRRAPQVFVLILIYRAAQWGLAAAAFLLPDAETLLREPALFVLVLLVVMLVLGAFGMLYVFALCELIREDDVGPLEAIGRTVRSIHGRVGTVALVSLLAVGALLASCFAFCIGIVPGTAYATLVFVALYLTLRNGGGAREATPARF